MSIKKICDNLIDNHELSDSDCEILLNAGQEVFDFLAEEACRMRNKVYGNRIFLRGLIEITNYCRNDCYYCGLRCSNIMAERYRLSNEQIFECCRHGYELGYRTFVLQGGEDSFFSDELLTEIISRIKKEYPDCAVTLSLGERSPESFLLLRQAGADRYLLRHETADSVHYGRIHPETMSYAGRMKCLEILKKEGFQTGCGFMVGSPYQTCQNIVSDLMFIKKFRPEMVGIGPFIPQSDTPFAGESPGSVELTIRLLTIIRLMLPSVLLPATTALATRSDSGRIRGIKAGANVIMPNLTPSEQRSKYVIYDNKKTDGLESADMISQIKNEIKEIGMEIFADRGDYMEMKV